ncbi:MAG: histidine phosphatase family protein [Tessaracoccus sp.]|uniref:histidine phosphatase family protein n=1 Tax=Tessaracoccus sp. TaxID=1971211 RepID=UPI001EB7957B|nr:histidine phosphatase family protein [Tessaracoccus sp.]MBK7822004.1 histidine phosphatase family protein [Tessaracoccus sp.]
MREAVARASAAGAAPARSRERRAAPVIGAVAGITSLLPGETSATPAEIRSVSCVFPARRMAPPRTMGTADVNKRMMPSLNKIAKKAVKERDKRVLVVSSGLSITCVLDGLGVDMKTAISNVAVSKLVYKNGKWTVLTVGDTSYRQ